MAEIEKTAGGNGRAKTASKRHKAVSHYPIPAAYIAFVARAQVGPSTISPIPAASTAAVAAAAAAFAAGVESSDDEETPAPGEAAAKSHAKSKDGRHKHRAKGLSKNGR